MDVTGLCADKSEEANPAKRGNHRFCSAHSGLSPIQFAFLRTYLHKSY